MSSLHYNNEGRVPSSPVNSVGVFVEGDALVVPGDFVFPRICLATGAPADAEPEKFRFKHTNANDELSVGILVGGLWWLLFKSATTKSTMLQICLNQPTRARRRNLLIAALATVPVAIVLSVALIALTHNPYWFFLFLASIPIAWLFAWRRERIFGAKKVTPSFVWLSGVAPSVRDGIYQSGLRPAP